MNMPSSKIDEQRVFYNQHWVDFEFANRLKLARCSAILDCIINTKLYRPNIVDLGCGAGWLAGILGNFGPTVGVELADEAVAIASQRYPHVQYIASDIFNWNYPHEAFDIVVSQEVIEHVEDQAGYLSIAHNLLAKDGYLILTTPNPRTFNAMSSKIRNNWAKQPLENWLSRKDLRHLVKMRFRIIKLTTIILGHGSKGSYLFMNANRVQSFFSRIGLDDAFNHLRLSLGYGLHTLIVAQKRIN